MLDIVGEKPFEDNVHDEGSDYLTIVSGSHIIVYYSQDKLARFIEFIRACALGRTL